METGSQRSVLLYCIGSFDNFSHDLIRYDNTTGQPYEGKY